MHKLVIAFFFCTTGISLFLFRHPLSSNNIAVGYPKFWGPLVPAQQCTAYGDSIISNQFEPLVFIGSDHLIYPLAAKTWTVSDDFKVFTFKIDTSRRFSNGEYLTASHFKKAWEYGLSMESSSHNASTVEILSYIEGFENYEKSKEISGIEVIDPQTLKVTFKFPFRLALDNLTGNRFGAFIKDGDRFIGTGRYVINKTESDEQLSLTINPYHKDSEELSNITIKVVGADHAKDALLSGDIDVYEYAFLADFSSVCRGEVETLTCASGLEFAHAAIEVNALKGRFFHNQKYRQALQFLIFDRIKKSELPHLYSSDNFKDSHQVFLPLQMGGLEEKEVESIIANGKKYVSELIEKSQKMPIRINYSNDGEWLEKLLTTAGIKLATESGKTTWPNILKMQYKTNEMDLYLGAFSVVNGDPDGIYHKLGKHGAILSPSIYQEKVGKLLEEGRAIIKHDQINDHYQKVTRAVLEEVPIIHLGFIHGMSVYRNDRVKNAMNVKNREDNRLHFYKRI